LIVSTIAASVVDLPAPVRTRHENETTRAERQVAHDRGQVQLLDARHLDGHVTQRHRGGAALHEHVRAESREPGDAEREVDLVMGREVLAAALR
jgi:hypothetical protein